MGIRLDWEVETKAGGRTIAQGEVRPPRRPNIHWGAILIPLAVLMMLAIGAAVVVWRLNEANRFIESLLHDTIEAEFAALRFGDRAAFDAVQRSATDEWLAYQGQIFEAFQAGKASSRLELTGTVRVIDIDGTRGRAIVEWIDDGTPYSQAWFYWRYEDGWRHVPPDYTFWGDSRELRGQNVTVRYRTVDAALAEPMGLRVEGWIASVCGPILQCGDLPHITLEILSDPYAELGWGRDAEAWTLRLLSPYVNGARTDQPFSGAILESAANAVAERLIGASLSTREPFDRTTDAGYLITATQTWLVGQFVGLDTGSTVIQSLADTAGRTAVGVLLGVLTPTSTLEVVLAAVGQTDITQANLNWSDWVAQRARREAELIATGDTVALMRLYSDAGRGVALDRAQRGVAPTEVQATTEPVGVLPDGRPVLRATLRVVIAGSEQSVAATYVWEGGTWLRDN
jgi:hypothetical protein